MIVSVAMELVSKSVGCPAGHQNIAGDFEPGETEILTNIQVKDSGLLLVDRESQHFVLVVRMELLLDNLLAVVDSPDSLATIFTDPVDVEFPLEKDDVLIKRVLLHLLHPPYFFKGKSLEFR